VLGERDCQGMGSGHSSRREKCGDPASATAGIVKELRCHRHTPAVGLPRTSLPAGHRIHQPGPCHSLLSGGLQGSARTRQLSIEQRRNTKQQVQSLREPGVLFVNAVFESVELAAKLGEMALGQSQTGPFSRHIWSIRVFFRQLRQAVLRTLDLQLIEIPDGEVE